MKCEGVKSECEEEGVKSEGVESEGVNILQ